METRSHYIVSLIGLGLPKTCLPSAGIKAHTLSLRRQRQADLCPKKKRKKRKEGIEGLEREVAGLLRVLDALSQETGLFPAPTS